MYKGMGLNVKALMLEIDFVRMAGVSDPETKRKIIGRVFYRSFFDESFSEDVKWLAQGTIYPDVIESVSVKDHQQL
jgi:GMP synthase (glutamine-hydrolysing)